MWPWNKSANLQPESKRALVDSQDRVSQMTPQEFKDYTKHLITFGFQPMSSPEPLTPDEFKVLARQIGLVSPAQKESPSTANDIIRTIQNLQENNQGEAKRLMVKLRKLYGGDICSMPVKEVKDAK